MGHSQNIFILLFDIITIVISLYWFIINIKNIVKGSRYVFYYIVFALYVLPLVLDYVYLFPEYTYSFRLNGFAISQNDPITRCAYDITVLICQWVLLYFRIRQYNAYLSTITYHELNYRKERNYQYIITIGMVFPFLLVMIFPISKAILYSFQWREIGSIIVNLKYLSILEHFSYIGACCSLVFLLDKRKELWKRILGIIFLYINICIQGKRAMLFFSFLVFLLVMIPGMSNRELSEKKKRKKLSRTILFASIVIVIMLLTTIRVQTDRTSGTITSSILYTTTRIDFFRDDRVRVALFSAFNPDRLKILNYPGQSIWPLFTWLFPIDYLLNMFGVEFYSYQTYFTAAIEGLSVETTSSQMTTCLLAELISNFHVLGIVIFAAFSIWLAKKADKYMYPMNVLTITLFIVLQMFSLKYMAYLIEFVLLLNYGSRIKFIVGNRS